jgi:heme iron utilization protein
MTRGDEARRLLRRFDAGVLATHSEKQPGYPYGSALPFCTDQRGRVILLMSHLAEHTCNVERDARVSFTVSPMHAQLQREARATVIGDCVPIDEPVIAGRFLRMLPQSREYLDIGGFRFFAIEPGQLRLIAGFGSLHWIDGASLLAPDLPIAKAEADILRHMNADHAAALLDYCRHTHGLPAGNAEMVGIDCDGFDIRADGSRLRFDFAQPVRDAGQARSELVALAREARG